MENQIVIGVSDFRKIVAALKDVGGKDLSEYSLLPLKHRFERAMSVLGLPTVDRLLDKLFTDKVFVDLFEKELYVPTTEMFRDSQLWVELEDIVFKHQDKEGTMKIWMPEVCGDEELYTLLVMLQRSKLTQRSVVYATSTNKRVLEDVQKGRVDNRRMEVNEANIKKFDEKATLEHYFDSEDKYKVFVPQLLENVVFIHHDFFHLPPPDNGFDLVLFRNRMLYYSQKLKVLAVNLIYECLAKGGYFVCGVGETLEGCDPLGSFRQVSKTEKIFVKSN